MKESRFRGNGNGFAFSSEVDPAHVKKMRSLYEREPIPWKRKRLQPSVAGAGLRHHLPIPRYPFHATRVLWPVSMTMNGEAAGPDGLIKETTTQAFMADVVQESMKQ